MAIIRAFQGIRPKEGLAERIAALPYDVYSEAEAREEVKKEPMSFLKIDRAETQFRKVRIRIHLRYIRRLMTF